MIDLDYLKKYYKYDPMTGKITRGKFVLTGTNSQGYIQVKSQSAHRVAWFLHYGEWPKGHINHKNGIKTDDRIENLELITARQNTQHYYLTRKSLNHCIYFSQQMKRHVVDMKVNGVRRARSFKTLEEAREWRDKMRKQWEYSI